MDTAKIIKTGRSQAVRIPKKFRFSCKELAVHQMGNSLVLTPIKEGITLEEFLAMPKFADFVLERPDALHEEKRELF